MTDKRRTSITLDELVAERVREDDAAFSPLVNRWAEEYYLDGRRPNVSKTKLEEMLDELDDREAAFEQFVEETESMFENHRAVLEGALDDVDDTIPEDVETEIEDIYNRLTNRTKFNDYSTPRDPENPAIRQHASRVGITPEQLAEELRRRDRRDGYSPKRTANDATKVKHDAE